MTDHFLLGIDRRTLLSALARASGLVRTSCLPPPRRRKPQHRVTLCHRGTTVRQSRQSSTSCASPRNREARTLLRRRSALPPSIRTARYGSSIRSIRRSCIAWTACPPWWRKKPELKNVEPFKTVLSGNREAIAKLSMKDLEKILVATLTGMSVDEFNAEVKKWLETAKDPRWKRPYTDLIYQPMLEVMRYLRATATRPTL